MKQLSLLLLLIALFGCTTGPDSSAPARLPLPRLVLLYAPCTVNADFLSPYADPVDVSFTPRLARFASEAMVFERHMTESGQSGPAYASIFTGRHADGHGVFHHPTPIVRDVPVLGEVFRDGGFYVEEWLAHVMASEELGYGRGAHAVHPLVLTHDTPEFVRLLETLRVDPQARALVVANHTLTHAPYRVESLGPFCSRYPAECALRTTDPRRFDAAAGFYLNHHAELSHDLPDMVARFDLSVEQIDYLARVIAVLYRANVARLDHHFGTLLDAVESHGLAAESLVVFTADHGEATYRPDLLFPWTHGHQLAPEVLRVPLLIRGPGLTPGRYSAVTRSTDLMPTLASLAGITPPVLPTEPWNGVDLSETLQGRAQGETREEDLEAYSHTALTAEVVLEESTTWALFRRWFPREDPRLMWAQLRSGESVVQLRRTLEDLEKDETGSTPVEPVFSGPDVANRAALEESVRTYRERLIGAWNARSGDEDFLDEERQKELLRRLGYIE